MSSVRAAEFAIESVLVVDDDPLSLEFLGEAFRRAGRDVRACARPEDAVRLVAEGARFDLVVTDLKMPGMDGHAVLSRVREIDPLAAVVVVTGYGTLSDAVAATKNGAEDFLAKPFSLEQIDMLLARLDARRRALAPVVEVRPRPPAEEAWRSIGETSPALVHVLEAIDRVTPTKATVLIQGESGVGKELVAHRIHYLGPRRSAPFIRVNCAALAPSLLESELFGHEKGAFTGAVRRREGRFELANRGTLLLDEIGELPLTLQPKLLRVLEEEEFERVGGTTTLRSDVRVLATTNRDLGTEVAAGRFRGDLFYRLNVMPIPIPPLRERVADVAQLVEHFLARYAREARSPLQRVSPEALDLLSRHPWPGNVRELENLVQRLVVLVRDETLRAEHVRPHLAPAAPPATATPPVRMLSDLERETILKTLSETGFNQSEAARKLGLSPRTLYNKIRRYEAEGILPQRRATARVGRIVTSASPPADAEGRG
ncbi:MAG: sigma-54-dependent Fis family transcriptional regulator [Planctomycetes bacterium]|nr:sigma-54-dependent Fis family transcriptional regulator [Planctomycetota bacterium]